MKRTLIIVAIVLLVGLGLYLGRSFIFKSALPEQPVVEDPETGTEEEPEPVVDEVPDVLTQISATAVVDYWVDPSDRTVYFIDASGWLYRVLAGGVPERVYSAAGDDLAHVSPAPKGVQALVKTGRGDTAFFSVIDPATKTKQFLPIGTTAAAWGPDAKEIVYLKNKALNIFTVANGRSRLVTSLNMNDILLDWKKPKEVYIGAVPAAGLASGWWSYHLDKKTLVRITEELPGLTVRWSADGSTGLMFANETTGRAAGLTMIRPDQSAETSLGMVTLPEKCALDVQVIYCAEPLDVDASTLPDGYYQNAYTVDSILRIEPGQFPKKTSIYSAGGNKKVDVYHPLKIGSSLYFINRYDRAVYKLAL